MTFTNEPDKNVARNNLEKYCREGFWLTIGSLGCGPFARCPSKSDKINGSIWSHSLMDSQSLSSSFVMIASVVVDVCPPFRLVRVLFRPVSFPFLPWKMGVHSHSFHEAPRLGLSQRAPSSFTCSLFSLPSQFMCPHSHTQKFLHCETDPGAFSLRYVGWGRINRRRAKKS